MDFTHSEPTRVAEAFTAKKNIAHTQIQGSNTAQTSDFSKKKGKKKIK
jgi:hypothetical protein